MRNTSAIINIFLFVLVFTAIHQPTLADTVKPPGEIAYKDRIQFVKTLLEKSSAARKIEESGNVDALAHRDVARAHFEKAKKAYAADDLETANNELIEATRVMFEAARLTNNDEFTAEKKKRDFRNRLGSINALMEAHNRVTQEKGKQSDRIELKKVVADKVKMANSLLKEGRLDEARTVLDEAYVAAKIAINTLRGGDTLVRTLHFETSEEEYLYEIDRNDTHKMLLHILNKDKDKAVKMSKMASSFFDKAAELRNKAEQQASAGDYEAAIKLLEESTKNLVRALRGSGIFIPG